MFAVKMLTIIIALQVINKSYSFPYGGLGGLGTMASWTSGLMSLISSQVKTKTEETLESQTETTPFFDLFDLDETKRDNPERPRANCSTSCAKKTFKELMFIHKLFQSMENMYGNINDRLNEITADSGRAKRSVPKQKGRKTKRQTSTRAKRSQENPNIGRANDSK